MAILEQLPCGSACCGIIHVSMLGQWGSACVLQACGVTTVSILEWLGSTCVLQACRVINKSILIVAQLSIRYSLPQVWGPNPACHSSAGLCSLEGADRSHQEEAWFGERWEAQEKADLYSTAG